MPFFLNEAKSVLTNWYLGHKNVETFFKTEYLKKIELFIDTDKTFIPLL